MHFFFFFFITSNYKDGQTRGWTKPRHVGRKYHLRNLTANSQNRSLHKKKLFLPNLYWDLRRSWSSAAFVQIFLSNLSVRRFDCTYINEVFRMQCCKWSIWQFLTCHLVWHVSALKPNIVPVCFCHPFFIDVKDMQARRPILFSVMGVPRFTLSFSLPCFLRLL